MLVSSNAGLYRVHTTLSKSLMHILTGHSIKSKAELNEAYLANDQCHFNEELFNNCEIQMLI